MSETGVSERLESETRTEAKHATPLDTLRSELVLIRSELAELKAGFERRLSNDQTMSKAFDRLYEDLEIFRGQAAFQASRPVFLEIVLLLDRLDQALAADVATTDHTDLLESIRVELVEILARRAIVPVATPDGRFDPKLQRAIETIPAEREEAHNSIAQILRQGYEQNGNVVRTADVVVRRHTATAPAPP
jgi:molecular chaperone GrpE (heat shock protein)